MISKRMNQLFASLSLFAPLLVVLPCSVAQPVVKNQADVVIYGGTASGVMAAVAAAREGKSVVLLEPSKHIGGMVTGGLGATDVGNAKAIGGYSKEFFNRVLAYYVKKYGEKSQQLKDCAGGFRIEPHVASHVLKEMMDEVKIKPMLGQRLASVEKKGKAIASIKMETGEVFAGKVFIDASYEGDLMAKAGVSYTYGREAASDYNESIAGVQKHSPAHQWPVKVSGLDAGGKLLPFIQSGNIDKPGAGDKKVQTYNFRLCLTQVPELRLPFPKPDNYDPKKFELLARYLEKKPDLKVGKLMNPVKVPNGKTDTNNNGAFSTDYIGGNWDYPEADYAKREQSWKEHADYTKGFLYFLANDPRVPKALHDEMNTWGLSKGEFEETGNWPPQLYVREARRMLGVYIMTQKDIMTDRFKDDSVGLGSYNTDSHHVQRVVLDDGTVLNEGDFQVGVQPYAIPYRSLIPKGSECTNLLVPVCLSATHVAYGTIRMEPVYMILGQASGVAAALAVDGQTSVQGVEVQKLVEKLKAQKAVLSPEGLGKKFAPGQAIDPGKLKGIVVDDKQAIKTGHWVHSASVGPFVGEGYLHDNNENQGKAKVRFVPNIAKAGKYEIRLFYTANPNRATNTLVVIHTAAGEKELRINQKKAPKDGAVSLGVYQLMAGNSGWVEIRNDQADGYVIADAIFLVTR